MRGTLAIALALLVVAAVQQTDYRAQALRVLRAAPLVDGHNDLPDAIRERGGLDSVDIGTNQPTLHTDLARMRAGGLTAQFWAAYVPVTTLDTAPGPAVYAMEQIALIHRLCHKHAAFA